MTKVADDAAGSSSEPHDDWETLHAGRAASAGPFLRLTPYDRPQRRALRMQWVRGEGEHAYTPAAPGVPRAVTLRAGREGGDAEMTLLEGEPLTAAHLDELVDVLLTMRFGLDDVYQLAERAWRTPGDSTYDIAPVTEIRESPTAGRSSSPVRRSKPPAFTGSERAAPSR
jgi:hypothetical protein